MKKYKIIVIAVIALITFNSCDDFLTTELTSASKTSESYYRTPAQDSTALIGCYNGLNLIWNSGIALPLAAEMASDNCFSGFGTSDDKNNPMIDEFEYKWDYPDMFKDNWKAYYQAIFRCNLLLVSLDKTTWGNRTALHTQIEAESKFLRANFYFDLARLFQKVPLVLTPTADLVAQSEPAATYAQIMSDLRFAVDNLPATKYYNTTNGRVTKWAAESLLARAYLFYSGYYGTTEIGGETKATALAAVEDAISNSGHDLVSDFNTLWPAASDAKNVTYAGEDNPEVVFSIKYNITGNYNGSVCGNAWLVNTGLRGVNFFPYGQGWGGCTVDPKLWNTYLSTDTRRFATITSIADESIDYSGSAGTTREYTTYFLKKYSPECLADNKTSKAVSLGGVNNMIGQYQDYFAIRYADVLLMAAELGSTNAALYYNKVHQRAIPTASSVSSVTKDDILAERRLEFAGEGIRYWDLLRQGIDKAASTIATNTTTGIQIGGQTAAQLESNIKKTGGFQQIPTSEITLAGSANILTQNSGW